MNMRRMAIITGGVCTLGLAGLCWAYGLEAHVCAMRAAAGGAMIGGIVLVAGNLVLRVIVDAMVKDASQGRGFHGYSDNPNE
jgi:hypothetical protein